jgi:hypothetical protein
MLIVSSPEEFSFIDNYTTPLFFIFNAFSQCIGFFVLWPAALYFLFSSNISKIKYAFAGLGFFLCTAAILNTFIFPGNYGLISINMQLANGAGHPSREIVFNMLILGISALAGLFLFHSRFQKFLTPVLSVCLIVLLGMSLVNIFRINSAFSHLQSFQTGNREEISLHPFFSLSRKGKNTVVIMLDRASSSFFPYILKESPNLKEIYSGFTYYPNTVSFNGYTIIGAPPIFGGYEYNPAGD